MSSPLSKSASTARFGASRHPTRSRPSSASSASTPVSSPSCASCRTAGLVSKSISRTCWLRAGPASSTSTTVPRLMPPSPPCALPYYSSRLVGGLVGGGKRSESSATTKSAPALTPAAAGDAPLPSIKEFPEEEPAPSARTLRFVPMRLTPSRFRCVGRRRLDFLNQGVSRGEPGGERLVCCAVQELAPIS